VTANDTEEGYGDATTVKGPVAFGFPDRYRIDVADDPDFANARTVVDRTDEDQPDPRREPGALKPEATGRYVRVVATAPDGFEPDERDISRLREERRTWEVFALAKLSVRSGGEAIARGCPVMVSSSVESDTWGMAHLTNGDRGVDDLDWAAASVETPHGDVASEWEQTDEGLTLHVEIPWNLSASIRLSVDAETTVRHGTDELRRSDDASRLPPRVDDVTRDGTGWSSRLHPGGTIPTSREPLSKSIICRFYPTI
jgi:hypothetical protein